MNWKLFSKTVAVAGSAEKQSVLNPFPYYLTIRMNKGLNTLTCGFCSSCYGYRILTLIIHKY